MKATICGLAILLLTALSNKAEGTVLEFLSTSRGDVPVLLPDDYLPGESLPLIMALHGRGSSAESTEEYFDFQLQVDQRRFIYVIPEGTSNIFGTFWNATDACCDFFGSDVDDSGYLRGVIELAQSTYSIDPDRIHVVGYSNGGFMAHRLAIDHSDLIASIVSVAGANFKEAKNYAPAERVHTLEIHGTQDGVIFYDGGTISAPYPGAIETQSNWATYNLLNSDIDDVGAPFDLDLDVAGPEATSKIFDINNEPGIKVELWTLTGSGHGPDFGDGLNNLFAQKALDWVFVHAKPRIDLVTPDSFEVVRGDFVSGGLTELFASDDQDLVVRRALNEFRPETITDVSSTSPTTSPNSIRIRFEGSVFARQTISQTIQLFDYQAADWETVDQQSASRFTDSIVEVRASGSPARFVDPNTREMKARIIHTAPINRATFSVGIDEAAWTIFR